MSLRVKQFPVAGFDRNFSYLIADKVTRDAYLIDPTGNIMTVLEQLKSHEYHIVGILLTHTHHDHLEQVDTAVAKYGVPVHVYVSGRAALDSLEDVRSLTDGDTIKLGTGEINVIYTPGHTDDSVCFYIKAEQAESGVPKVITGDTLFVGGSGRTDETRVKDLYESLAELAALPDETEIYPGHDYGDTATSTIGHEKATNRFYQVDNFNAFKVERLG